MTPRQFRRKLGSRRTRKQARWAHKKHVMGLRTKSVHRYPTATPYKHQREILRQQLAKETA